MHLNLIRKKTNNTNNTIDLGMFMFENHRFDLKLMEYFYLSGMRSKS